MKVRDLIEMLQAAEERCEEPGEVMDAEVLVSVPMGHDKTPYRRIFAEPAGDCQVNCDGTVSIFMEQGEDNEDMTPGDDE